MDSTQDPQFRLKDSVYALHEPNADLYFSLKGPKPQLKPLRFATLAPTTAHCRGELAVQATEKLQGQCYELVRVDA